MGCEVWGYGVGMWGGDMGTLGAGTWDAVYGAMWMLDTDI